MGALPSLKPTVSKEDQELQMSSSEAIEILRTTIAGRPQQVKDKSRFRYVMYRAPVNTKFLRIILRLLPRHPEYIDAFIAYFSNYSKKTSIAKAALNYLLSGVPYSYVRGELWHIVARLGSYEDMRKALPLAREDAKNRSCCIMLSWGVMHFLMVCEEKNLARLGKRLANEHPISRSFLVPKFTDKEFSKNGHANTLLNGTLMEQLAIAREIQKRQILLNSLGINKRNLSNICQRTLKSLGVIGRLYRRTTRDLIKEVLASLYSCKNITIWRESLTTEYEHALQILIEAKARFPGNYSDWLSLQDSFNDIVIRQLFNLLQRKGLRGYSNTVNRNGHLIDYGVLISIGHPFDRAYPSEANELRIIHNRRNQLPGNHPYSKRGGSRNTWLKRSGRDSLVIHVKKSLDGIATIVENNI